LRIEIVSNESVQLMETNPNHNLNSEMTLHDMERCLPAQIQRCQREG
jgi:uncharacterized protein YjiK